MKDPIVIGVAAIVAVVLVPILLWLALAVFGGSGCGWILGFGGCLPWVPTPPTV